MSSLLRLHLSLLRQQYRCQVIVIAYMNGGDAVSGAASATEKRGQRKGEKGSKEKGSGNNDNCKFLW